MLSLIALCALFAATGFFNRAFERHEKEIAQEWYGRGEAELNAGRAESALDPLRTALLYSRDNPEYELRLAQALVAGQHYGEAKAYLLTLWERQPGSSALNLELARLAARQGDVSEAIHYYEACLYGVWEANGEGQRRGARLELIAYLSGHGREAEAVAQTTELAANLPPDPQLRIQAGELFLKEQSYQHATEQFQEAVRAEPRSAAALAGAGRAAMASGEYADAERYLGRANRADPGDRSLWEPLALARSVVSLDPDAPGLSAAQRIRRAIHAFVLAKARVRACWGTAGGGQNPAVQLLAERAKPLDVKLKQKTLNWDLELHTAVVDFALGAEQTAAASCGPGSVEDRALALLALHRGALTR